VALVVPLPDVSGRVVLEQCLRVPESIDQADIGLRVPHVIRGADVRPNSLDDHDAERLLRVDGFPVRLLDVRGRRIVFSAFSSDAWR
jgi:hypothetical protein